MRLARLSRAASPLFFFEIFMALNPNPRNPSDSAPNSLFATLAERFARKLEGAPNLSKQFTPTRALNPDFYGRPDIDAFGQIASAAEAIHPGAKLSGVAFWGTPGTPSRMIYTNANDSDFPATQYMENAGKTAVLRADLLMERADGSSFVVQAGSEFLAQHREQNPATAFALWAIAEKISVARDAANPAEWQFFSAKNDAEEALSVVHPDKFAENWRNEANGRFERLREMKAQNKPEYPTIYFSNKTDDNDKEPKAIVATSAAQQNALAEALRDNLRANLAAERTRLAQDLARAAQLENIAAMVSPSKLNEAIAAFDVRALKSGQPISPSVGPRPAASLHITAEDKLAAKRKISQETPNPNALPPTPSIARRFSSQPGALKAAPMPDGVRALSVSHRLDADIYGRPDQEAFSQIALEAERQNPNSRFLGLSFWGDQGAQNWLKTESGEYGPTYYYERLGRDTQFAAQIVMMDERNQRFVVPAETILSAKTREFEDATAFAQWARSEDISVLRDSDGDWSWASIKPQKSSELNVMTLDRFAEDWNHHMAARHEEFRRFKVARVSEDLPSIATTAEATQQSIAARLHQGLVDNTPESRARQAETQAREEKAARLSELLPAAIVPQAVEHVEQLERRDMEAALSSRRVKNAETAIPASKTEKPGPHA